MEFELKLRVDSDINLMSGASKVSFVIQDAQFVNDSVTEAFGCVWSTTIEDGKCDSGYSLGSLTDWYSSGISTTPDLETGLRVWKK